MGVPPPFHALFPLLKTFLLAVELIDILKRVKSRAMQVLVCLGYYSKIPWTGWATQQTFVSHSSRGWKSEVKVAADLVLGEGPRPGLQMATFLPCPHMVVVRKSSGVSSSS